MLEEILAPGLRTSDAPGMPTAMEKMAYAGPDLEWPGQDQAIVCNAHITLTGIPEQAHEYRLGSAVRRWTG